MGSRFRDVAASNSALKRVGASWFLVNFAEWGYVTALSIYGYRLYGALGVGLIGARFALGAIFGSMLVGTAARGRPASALRALSLARAVAVGASAVAVGAHFPLAILVAIVWIDAVIAAPYRPIQSSVLPALAGTPQELSSVAGSVPSTKALAQAAGGIAGSALLAVVAPQTVAAISAGTFVIAGSVLSSIRVDGPQPVGRPADDDSRTGRRFGAIGAGFELIARRARPLLVLGGFRSLTRGLWTSLAVVVAIRLLHLGSAGVGILGAAGGLGAAIAVPLSLRLAGRPRLAGPAALAYLLAGLPVTLIGAIALSAPVVALVAVWGTAMALADSISNALVHRVVEARRLAPSVAAIESSKLLLEGVGALLAPALLTVLGIRTALVATGALLPLLVLFSRPGLLALDESAEARHRPLSALRRTPSFRGLNMMSLESLAARLQATTEPCDTAVVRQGEVGDRFYLIDSGHVEVTVEGFRVAVLGPGGSFGEKALLRATPRSATVTTLEECGLWYLDGADFIAAATGDEAPAATRAARPPEVPSVEEALDAVPLFAAIDRRALGAQGQLVAAAEGEQIVREGEHGDRFYVLLEGELEASSRGRTVQLFQAGDWFGEIALLHTVPRRATVTARTPVRLWALAREAFLAALHEAAALDSTLAVAVDLPVAQAGPAAGHVGLAGAGLLV